MEKYTGKSIFKGIAIGKILFYQKGEQPVKRMKIEDTAEQIKRYEDARAKAAEQLQGLYEKALKEVGEANAAVFEVHQMMLEDDDYIDSVVNIIETQQVNAEFAVATTGDNFAKMFAEMEDDYFKARAADVKDISERMVNILSGNESGGALGDEPVIVVTESITPTELMEMDKDKLMAIVTHHGSDMSHAAIMAKTMNIPALLEIDTDSEWDGRQAIVDGYTGTLYIDPDEEVKKEYEIRRQADKEEREELLKLRREPDITKDGRKIEIYANIGNMDDLNSVLYYGAAGIGLLRSEFQYLGRENYPRENELFLAYKKIAETMGEKLTVIRTADLGADKQAEYLNIPDETNPIMGNRGIRLCLDRKRMFKAQLRAIFRASAYGNLALMYPMISSEEEMDEIVEIIREVKSGLDEKGIPYKHIKTGIMIETPAAVMISGELAREADFFSIGTNDLLQLTLGMDRENPKLDKYYNPYHPALMKMIRIVANNVHLEGKRISICGDLAADLSMTEFFVQIGIDELSVAPHQVLGLRKKIREIQ